MRVFPAARGIFCVFCELRSRRVPVYCPIQICQRFRVVSQLVGDSSFASRPTHRCSKGVLNGHDHQGPPEEASQEASAIAQEVVLSILSRWRCASTGVRRDYKDLKTLKQLVDREGRILPRRRTGTSALYQRAVRAAVMRARFIGLLPYCSTD